MSTEFREEVVAIRNHYIYGRITRISAVVQFEALLHHYGLLPEDEEIDPNIPDAELVSMLNQATALQPKSIPAIREHQADRKQQEQSASLADAFGAVARNSFQPLCPVCHKQVSNVYREITIEGDEDEFGSVMNKPEVVKFDQPRCEECARDYLDEYHFGTKRSYIPDTVMAPMSLTEQKFFRFYEEQMKNSIK